MNYRVKIEKLGENNYFELVSVGTSKTVDGAIQQALEKLEQEKEKQEERIK